MSEIQNIRQQSQFEANASTTDEGRSLYQKETTLAARIIRSHHNIYTNPRPLTEGHIFEVKKQLQPLIPSFFDSEIPEGHCKEEYFHTLVDYITNSAVLDPEKKLKSLTIIEKIVNDEECFKKINNAFISGIINK
ncbi:MAG: hypothetical protein VX777_05220 [Chlamydiota bacterium]|nr:hypothetical protein [Chlamydiota bacterium]